MRYSLGLAGIIAIQVYRDIYFCDTVWPYRDIFKSIYNNHKLLEFVIALKAI